MGCVYQDYFIRLIYITLVQYRLIIMDKAYINYMPAIIIWWFLLYSSNFSFPFFPPFLGVVLQTYRTDLKETDVWPIDNNSNNDGEIGKELRR